MAQEKKKTTKAKQSTRSSANTQQKGEQQKITNNVRGRDTFISLLPFILAVVALLIVVFFIFTESTGIVGKGAKNFLYGLFSGAAWLIPILIINTLIFWKTDRANDNIAWKLIDSAIVLVLVSTWFYYFYAVGKNADTSYNLKLFWERANERFFGGGGVIGGTFGWIFYKCFSKVGTPIVLLALTVIFGIFLFGLTPKEVWDRIKDKNAKRKRRKKYGSRDTLLYYNKPQPEEPGDDSAVIGKRSFDPTTVDEDPFAPKKQNDNPFVNVNPYASEEKKPQRRKDKPIAAQTVDEYKSSDEPETITAENAESEKDKIDYRGNYELDLDEIFYGKGAKKSAPEAEDKPADSIGEEAADKNKSRFEVEVKRRQLITTVARGEVEDALGEAGEDTDAALDAIIEKKEYRLPPVSLLSADHTARSADMSGEIQTNARKLVDTLASFKVRAKVVNVSRGPTITRYELAPEEGVRVRAIASLSDDISLSLASTGVRIEAPIPGKAAVGIEVPNRERETVYLRDLIDDERFESSKPKLTAAIGVDVAGDPIYIDIAKMPHLLVAGTTGSGKSVCMNCLILSILYKATPDEVKMIMIDPKKVEFNVYNGLPHLIVPVVTNPKKAAGALAWAVAEMERRYERIEGAGVRDLKNYNIVTKDDPEKEYMAQLVIFIDELADLMMTSPKEVEDYICRIAQKGRACGIHLIIGTQRPSVDVITGLIKANVPSRMAFTVSSQVDSRTILDIAGAEKLVGRGDMLFAPIGTPKPLRVQGAFVSDNEVEAVTKFIMSNVGDTEYDDSVMQDIEREAENCSVKGAPKKAGGDSGEGSEEQSDPMLDAAIDLAIESGKISTSLIQRRLSLGYGRAAKLIDAMEQMGVVSAPEGQKPRNVLISAQEWAQIKMARG